MEVSPDCGPTRGSFGQLSLVGVRRALHKKPKGRGAGVLTRSALSKLGPGCGWGQPRSGIFSCKARVRRVGCPGPAGGSREVRGLTVRSPGVAPPSPGGASSEVGGWAFRRPEEVPGNFGGGSPGTRGRHGGAPVPDWWPKSFPERRASLCAEQCAALRPFVFHPAFCKKFSRPLRDLARYPRPFSEPSKPIIREEPFGIHHAGKERREGLKL